MLGLILNETEIVNSIMEGNQELPSKPSKIIRLIIKKILIDGLNKEKIKDKIVNLLKKTYGENYNKSYWNTYIDNTIKSLEKKDNIKMIDLKNIEIYKEELEIIESLDNLRLEKLAFTLLVYAKINKIINPTSDGKINIPLTNIIKESSLNKNYNSKILLNELYNKKYILQGNSCDTTSIKINYIKNNGIVEINIDDLRDYQPITWYLEHKRINKYKKCECCGKRFEIKGNNNDYCNYCSKIKRKELMKIYNKNNYNKNINS